MYVGILQFIGNECTLKMSIVFHYSLVPFYLLGKAHGSLARAGKVRGQTPKVGAGISAGSTLCTVEPLYRGHHRDPSGSSVQRGVPNSEVDLYTTL